MVVAREGSAVGTGILDLGKGIGFLVGNVEGWWGRVLGWFIKLWLFNTLG